MSISPTSTAAAAAAGPIIKVPHRFLFIASIGNRFPQHYRQTRHSAGHILLDALVPLLRARIPHTGRGGARPYFYETFESPAMMNVSGGKVVPALNTWMKKFPSAGINHQQLAERGELTIPYEFLPTTTTTTSSTGRGQQPEWERRGTDPRNVRDFKPTLVILHDELEAPLGKVKVRRGGPNEASLRGHNGLQNIFDVLRSKKHYPVKSATSPRVMRVGVGIGRPKERTSEAVSKYVLGKMSQTELDAIAAAAGRVMDLLADEFYRSDDELK
ncbi:hypothetical protein ASPACDRAFT_46263 [Aspergillus aculeatus ATCC 16872]|uniref:Peptidyl-tRNA hydrolase n=1 Tax=Aspergillus aculeatus (strain ATCC 16872 / CBS 172.66 / WB 5094) TaxID=690307 RepID=A0A1L9WKQ5_ASPA1|nr:uncharacterized protein ASPACDRAFT_46263 [Aspergillus aculeatus ATCC 16872]OJJ96740.1 hypothetical protein ASPACDRAFT_46263 [Aspergillus aculeatus ATCC 16872]